MTVQYSFERRDSIVIPFRSANALPPDASWPTSEASEPRLFIEVPAGGSPFKRGKILQALIDVAAVTFLLLFLCIAVAVLGWIGWQISSFVLSIFNL